MRNIRRGLDMYDDIPKDMKRYLRENGYHFNKAIYEWAVGMMYKEDNNGKKEYIKPVEKEKVKELLKRFNITLKNDSMYDSCYVYCMCIADFYGKSLQTEEQVAKYIKDMIEDIDKPDGYIFNRWYADMCFAGYPIDWEEFI